MGSAASDLVGRTVGRYEVLELVATGRLAEVLVARRALAGGVARRVALKRILPRFAKDPAVRRAVAAGVVATSAHAGSGAVRVEDVVEEGGELLVEMELLDGVTLACTMDRARSLGVPFELAAVLHIGMAVAETLTKVHAAKDADGVPLVHAGLGPSSIFLTMRGETKLLEFGVERALSVLDPDTRSGLIGQRAQYLSPEQISFRVVDGKADVWALGVTLWELATGRTLFAGSTFLETLDLVRGAKVPAPSTVRAGVPEAFDRLLLDMLRADASARPTMAQVVSRLRGEVLPALGAPTPPRFDSMLTTLGLTEDPTIAHDATLPIALAEHPSAPIAIAPHAPEPGSVVPLVTPTDVTSLPTRRATPSVGTALQDLVPAARRPTPSAGSSVPLPIRPPTPSAGLSIESQLETHPAQGSATFVVGAPPRRGRAVQLARDALAIVLGAAIGWGIVEIVLWLARR